MDDTRIATTILHNVPLTRIVERSRKSDPALNWSELLVYALIKVWPEDLGLLASH